MSRKTRRKRLVTLATTSAPCFSSKVEIAKKTVPDPWEPGRTIVVDVNTRESTAEILLARGKIDRAEYDAAETFRRLWEEAQISPVRSVNVAVEAVDGRGAARDGVSDRTRSAQRKLANIRRATGARNFAILVAVIGEGVLLRSIAERHPRLKGNYAHGAASGRFFEALVDLTEHLRTAARGKERSTIRTAGAGEIGELAGAREWKIGRHGDAVEVRTKR